MARPRKRNTKAGKAVGKSQHKTKKGSGWQSDLPALSLHLDGLGFKIFEVNEDGNCFFRALADQLEGNQDEHMKYRTAVVQFIEENRHVFEPFVVRYKVPFDKYCLSMRRNGTWAGHAEVQAAAHVTQTNIRVHTHGSQPLYFSCDNYKADTINLSYHDEEHYNSVRLKEDNFIVKDNEVSASCDKPKVTNGNSEPETTFDIVKTETRCEDQRPDPVKDDIVKAETRCEDQSPDPVKDSKEDQKPWNQEQEKYVPPLINVYVRRRKRTEEKFIPPLTKVYIRKRKRTHEESQKN